MSKEESSSHPATNSSASVPTDQANSSDPYAQYYANMTEEQRQAYEQYYQQYYQQYGYDYSSYYPYAQTAQNPSDPNASTESTNPTAQPAFDPSAYYAHYSAYASTFPTPTFAYPTPVIAPAKTTPAEPTRSLYLGNVPDGIKEIDISEAFARFGQIENIKILPAKNCAFVKYVDLDSAIRAFNQMSVGGTIRGQPIKVGWGKAEPTMINKEEALASNSGPPPCRNIWLGNLPSDFTEQDVHEVLHKFGTIEKIKMLPVKNCAFIKFSSLDSAINAKHTLLGTMIRDRPVKINFGKEEALFESNIALQQNAQQAQQTQILIPQRVQKSPSPQVPKGPLIPPPPEDSPPPEDPQIQARIDKLAEFVKKNGATFEDMMKEKKKNDPNYSFIFENQPYNGYYKRKLWLLRYPEIDPNKYAEYLASQSSSEPPSSPTPSQSKASGIYSAVPPPNFATARPANPPFNLHPQSVQQPDEDIRKLNSFLENLESTKESIREVKNWILENQLKLHQIAGFISAKIEKFSDFEKRLCVLYLVHDVLHHTSRLENQQYFAQTFYPYLGSILKCCSDRQPPENLEKVIKVVKLWNDKQIYDPETIRQLEVIVHGNEQQQQFRPYEKEDIEKSDRDRNDRDRMDRNRNDRERSDKDRSDRDRGDRDRTDRDRGNRDRGDRDRNDRDRTDRGEYSDRKRKNRENDYSYRDRYDKHQRY